MFLKPSTDLGLPTTLADWLVRHRYTIPWVEGTAKDRNIIQGQFARPGQDDWAVLASVDGYSTILVFWNGSTSAPGYVARRRDDSIRALYRATPDFIAEHYRRYGGPRPPSPLDHDGIDDGWMGKGSNVWYFHRGFWRMLTGAD